MEITKKIDDELKPIANIIDCFVNQAYPLLAPQAAYGVGNCRFYGLET